eukprot:1311875-Alexandrium_andersonii.AAC.1
MPRSNIDMKPSRGFTVDPRFRSCAKIDAPGPAKGGLAFETTPVDSCGGRGRLRAKWVPRSPGSGAVSERTLAWPLR